MACVDGFDEDGKPCSDGDAGDGKFQQTSQPGIVFDPESGAYFEQRTDREGTISLRQLPQSEIDAKFPQQAEGVTFRSQGGDIVVLDAAGNEINRIPNPNVGAGAAAPNLQTVRIGDQVFSFNPATNEFTPGPSAPLTNDQRITLAQNADDIALQLGQLQQSDSQFQQNMALLRDQLAVNQQRNDRDAVLRTQGLIEQQQQRLDSNENLRRQLGVRAQEIVAQVRAGNADRSLDAIENSLNRSLQILGLETADEQFRLQEERGLLTDIARFAAEPGDAARQAALLAAGGGSPISTALAEGETAITDRSLAPLAGGLSLLDRLRAPSTALTGDLRDRLLEPAPVERVAEPDFGGLLDPLATRTQPLSIQDILAVGAGAPTTSLATAPITAPSPTTAPAPTVTPFQTAVATQSPISLASTGLTPEEFNLLSPTERLRRIGGEEAVARVPIPGTEPIPALARGGRAQAAAVVGDPQRANQANPELVVDRPGPGFDVFTMDQILRMGPETARRMLRTVPRRADGGFVGDSFTREPVDSSLFEQLRQEVGQVQPLLEAGTPTLTSTTPRAEKVFPTDPNFNPTQALDTFGNVGITQNDPRAAGVNFTGFLDQDNVFGESLSMEEILRANAFRERVLEDFLRTSPFKRGLTPIGLSAPGTSQFLRDFGTAQIALESGIAPQLTMEQILRLQPRGIGEGIVRRSA